MDLRDLIRARIAADGPLRRDHYMTDCLLHPTHGYYTTRDPLGAGAECSSVAPADYAGRGVPRRGQVHAG
jgi:hypothetical protein